MPARRLVVPLLIILLAAFLRLHRLADYLSNIDNAFPIAQAIGLLQSGHWPALGQITSVLYSNPPGMAYLAAVPWALFGTEWGTHCFMALLNLLAVPLVYNLMRRHGDGWQARAAALLAATNPWVIQGSRNTWVQGLLILGSTLIFGLLCRAIFSAGRNRARSFFFMLAALAAHTQMYLPAFLTLAPVSVIALLNLRRLPWRGAWLGLPVFALTTGVYIYHLAADWDFQSSRTARFFNPSAPVRVSNAALEHALRFVTGRDYEITHANEDLPALQMRRAMPLTISLGLTLVMVGGLARAVWRSLSRAPDTAFWLATLIWWITPVAALTASRYPVHNFYLQLTMPAGLVLAAPLLAPLTRRWRGLALAAILGLNSFLLLHAWGLSIAAHPAAAGLDSLSLRAAFSFRRTAEAVLDKLEIEELYVALRPESLRAKVGRDVKVVNWFHLPDLQILRTDRPAVYIREEHGQPPGPLPLAERAALLGFPGNDYIAFDVIPAYSAEELASLVSTRVEWPMTEGLTLLGYDLAPNGSQLISYWMVASLVDERDQWLFAPFAHVFDAQGSDLVNVGGLAVPGDAYRLGDVYRYQMTLPDLPTGEYTLALSLYDGVHGGLTATFLPPGEDPRPYYTAPIQLLP